MGVSFGDIANSLVSNNWEYGWLASVNDVDDDAKMVALLADIAKSLREIADATVPERVERKKAVEHARRVWDYRDEIFSAARKELVRILPKNAHKSSVIQAISARVAWFAMDSIGAHYNSEKLLGSDIPVAAALSALEEFLNRPDWPSFIQMGPKTRERLLGMLATAEAIA